VAFQGDPYLEVTIATTQGRQQSIAYPLDSSAEYIAKSLFDFIMQIERSAKKEKPAPKNES